MLLKTHGIVFRAIKYSESSLIIDLYTREKGLKKYIISGVRSPKAKVHANLFQVMTLLDIVGYDRPDKDLHRLKEVRSAFIYQHIPFNVVKSASGMFMLEVARKTILESEPNPELFDFLFSTFRFLDQTNNSTANIHLLFLIQLSAYLGFTPDLEQTSDRPFFDLQEGYFTRAVPAHSHYLDPEFSKLLAQFIASNYEEAHQIELSSQQRQDLLNRLLEYYRLHIDNFPTINAHTILQEILS